MKRAALAAMALAFVSAFTSFAHAGACTDSDVARARGLRDRAAQSLAVGAISQRSLTQFEIAALETERCAARIDLAAYCGAMGEKLESLLSAATGGGESFGNPADTSALLERVVQLRETCAATSR